MDNNIYPYLSASLYEDDPCDLDFECYNSAVNKDESYYKYINTRGNHSPSRYTKKSSSSKVTAYPNMSQKSYTRGDRSARGNQGDGAVANQNSNSGRDRRHPLPPIRKIYTPDPDSSATNSLTLRTATNHPADIPVKKPKTHAPRNNSRENNQHESSAENDDVQNSQSKNSGRVRLGLGDFTFYGTLVSLAASTDWIATVVCSFSVLVGLIATIFLLDIHGKALPALPISIVLGALSYFSSHLMLEFISSFITIRP